MYVHACISDHNNIHRSEMYLLYNIYYVDAECIEKI